MIKHIVIWKFKEHAEGADRAANVAKAKALLDACAQIAPGTLRFEVVTAQPGMEATADLMLDSEFVDAAALDAYLNHPQHVALKPFLGAVRERRECMDYECAAARSPSAVVAASGGASVDEADGSTAGAEARQFLS